MSEPPWGWDSRKFRLSEVIVYILFYFIYFVLIKDSIRDMFKKLDISAQASIGAKKNDFQTE